MSVDNAELSQESFETFKDKIAQLCHNLGHGEPSQILRMKGGSSNQVIGIRLPDLDKQDYIVRIPRFNTGDHQGNEILDQVSVLLHISEQGFARTPSILAYDSTTNNAIGKAGIVDWDDVMSAPLVLTRKPPTWLWDDEDYRTSGWDGDCDTKLTRDLTQNEMVVKAHFDQVIARLAPTYIDDAYHRGLWLRRLARFAIYGFSDDRDIERYEAFVEEWDAYYQSLVLDY
ncbi:hypothetical protein BJ875DRAFT_370148 [Amylocarpus encephaloides]|uniref:Aminoglycoside phosphotransferase domain-containing protein n=1 Tax=Amylocarpus encephaloides TaxID=45428 RepID=A0A9P7YPK4_9HELO|nr:hypothetical protein BJ875DRAFT_370148 [Amylocarpus encephaloides]